MKIEPERAGLPAPIPAQLPVFEHEGKLVADSRDVATFVEKEHRNLLRDIRRYVKVMSNLASSNLSPLNFFIEAAYTDEQGKTRLNFYCTEKGCAMIANKMTGEKGILFTALFVEAFYQMRERLELARWGWPVEDEEPELYDAPPSMGAYQAGRRETEAQVMAVRRQVQREDELHRARLLALSEMIANSGRRWGPQ